MLNFSASGAQGLQRVPSWKISKKVSKVLQGGLHGPSKSCMAVSTGFGVVGLGLEVRVVERLGS